LVFQIQILHFWTKKFAKKLFFDDPKFRGRQALPPHHDVADHVRHCGGVICIRVC